MTKLPEVSVKRFKFTLRLYMYLPLNFFYTLIKTVCIFKYYLSTVCSSSVLKALDTRNVVIVKSLCQWETFWDDRGQQTYRVNPLFSELCACSELRKQWKFTRYVCCHLVLESLPLPIVSTAFKGTDGHYW